MTDALLVDVQVEIGVPRDAAWSALTDGIGNWWPAEFYCGGRGDEEKVNPVFRPLQAFGGSDNADIVPHKVPKFVPVMGDDDVFVGVPHLALVPVRG